MEDPERHEDMFRETAKLLGAWLMPTGTTTCRTSVDVWNVFFILTWTCGLSKLRRCHHRKHYLRVVLRGFPLALQKALLYGDFTSAKWREYVASVLYATYTPESFPAGLAANYFIVSTESRVWYTGKTIVLRTKNRFVCLNDSM